MPLRFNKRSRPDRRKQRRSPPDYSSRGLQARLLLLVGALVLVMVAMHEARNPKYYRWLGFEGAGSVGGPPLAENEVAREEVDTRLRRPAPPPGAQREEAITVQPGLSPPARGSEEARSANADLLQRETVNSWSDLLRHLDARDRLRLYQVVKAARDGQAPPDEAQEHWPGVLAQLDARWQAQHTEARSAVLQMRDAEPDKALWLELLRQLDASWRRVRDALQSCAEDRPLDEGPRQALLDLQKVFDQIAFRAVEDNTVVSRPAEYDAWFRAFDLLDSKTADQIRQQSVGRVGFLQLYKQPKSYRGKFVTVRGTARLGYHVRAPKNIYGIEGYYVFVLKPAGGPNSPILVYTLQTPPGFPPIKDKDIDKATTPLREDVEFTGLFFKNCAYRARDTTRVAPLMMAKMPRWEPAARELVRRQMPGLAVLVGAPVAIAVVAVLISVIVYVQSRRRSPSLARYGATQLRSPDELQSLDRENVLPGVDEALRQLSSSDKTEGKG